MTVATSHDSKAIARTHAQSELEDNSDRVECNETLSASAKSPLDGAANAK